MKTAILVDGVFFVRRASKLLNVELSAPQELADALFDYCTKHIAIQKSKNPGSVVELYRIFYYDCPPIAKNVFHPLTGKDIFLGKSDLYKNMNQFLSCLTYKRKLALRLGTLLNSGANFVLTPEATKSLFSGSKTIEDCTENDFSLSLKQKGVDMKIGLDIASLAYKKQVDQIILIAGDSDFVPAAKLARREGIDFILDPMWHPITPDLNEHIDGILSACAKPLEIQH